MGIPRHFGAMGLFTDTGTRKSAVLRWTLPQRSAAYQEPRSCAIPVGLGSFTVNYNSVLRSLALKL